MTRRQVFQWIGGISTVLACTAGYSRLIEPQWVQIEKITLNIPSLPTQLAGKRLAQLSDFHLGPYFTQQQLSAAIQQVNHLRPDWLMLTGDYATLEEKQRLLLPQKIKELIEPLRAAQMPVFAVLGNHDFWLRSQEKFINGLSESGATVLRNSNVQLEHNLWLAGVDDAWGGSPNLRAAMNDIPNTATTLLMAHEPDFMDKVVLQNAPIAAQFSGHSHGGQIRLPLPMAGSDGRFNFAPVLPYLGKRYPIGLRRVGERYVYTNRGLGAWPMPYRLNCPPEITLFTLQTA